MDVYNDIWNAWMKRWNNSVGTCTYHMIRNPIPATYATSPTPVPAVPPARPQGIQNSTGSTGSTGSTAPVLSTLATVEQQIVTIVTPQKWFWCC